MNERRNIARRTVLKGIGAGAVGSLAFAGVASAGGTGDNRRQDSFTWAGDELYEMLESEPHPPTKDAEGNESAHRPIYLVAPQDNPHSPHVGSPPAPFDADHVIGLEPGKKFFSAQWHVNVVIDKETGAPAASVGENPLTNVNVILDNAGEGEPLTIVPTEIVFTCPVRPHRHKGSTDH